MNCDAYIEACSAAIDGEEAPLPAEESEAHLAGCHRCQVWTVEALRLHQQVHRAVATEPVPELTVRVLTVLEAERARSLPAPRPAAGVQRWEVGALRLALAAVAIVQLAIAVPAFLGRDGGAPIHIAREQGSWGIALAVGLLFAAWRPSVASGMVPVMLALVAGLAFTTGLDIAASRAAASSEAPHVFSLLGLGILELIAHPHWLFGRRPPRRPLSHA